MRSVRVVAVAVALVAACAGCDWAQIGAGPGHTMVNPVEPSFSVVAGPLFTTSWTTPCACLPALEAGGVVYAADGYGGIAPRTVTLRALDAATGATLWNATVPDVNSAKFLGIGNGLAYVDVETPSSPPEVVALDAKTGASRWSVTPPATSANVELALGGVVLDGATLLLANDLANANALVAIDSAGHVKWTANPPGHVDDVVADPGNVIYAASHVDLSNGSRIAFLTGYAEADGTALSTVRLAGVAGRMLFANDLLYVNDTALHPGTGAVAWSAPGETVAAVTPSLAITGDTTGALVARNALTGAQVWRQPDAFRTAASSSGQDPVVAGSLVFVGHPTQIDVRSLSDGSDLGTTPPVGLDVDMTPAAGRLLVTSGPTPTLYAFAPTSS